MMQLFRLALATATVLGVSGIPFISAVKIGDKVSASLAGVLFLMQCEHMMDRRKIIQLSISYYCSWKPRVLTFRIYIDVNTCCEL